MGIQLPSLYAAFGNKRSLFPEALNLYIAGPARIARGMQEGELPASTDAKAMADTVPCSCTAWPSTLVTAARAST